MYVSDVTCALVQRKHFIFGYLFIFNFMLEFYDVTHELNKEILFIQLQDFNEKRISCQSFKFKSLMKLDKP